MLLSRRIDDKEIQLKRQNKIFFQISGAGHEAVLAAAGTGLLRPAYDWFYMYYRDRALCLAPRHDARGDALRSRRRSDRPELRRAADAVALRATRRSTSSAPRHPPARSSCRRSVVPRASSALTALRLTEGVAVRRDRLRLHRATAPPARGSSGSPQHGVATSSSRCVYVVEDNGYAISVPVEVNTAGGSISKLVSALPRALHPGSGRLRLLRQLRGDAARRRSTRASARDRRSCTRTVIRPYSHSLSDDEVMYRPAEERDGRRGARPAHHLPALAGDARLRDRGGAPADPRRRRRTRCSRRPTMR